MLWHRTVGTGSSSLTCPETFRVVTFNWFLYWYLTRWKCCVSLVPFCRHPSLGARRTSKPTLRSTSSFLLQGSLWLTSLCSLSRMQCIQWHDVLGNYLERFAIKITLLKRWTLSLGLSCPHGSPSGADRRVLGECELRRWVGMLPG